MRLWSMFLVTVLLAGAAAGACVPAPEFVGAWEWTQASGGIAGVVIGPQDVGYTVQLVVRADGTIASFHDGILWAESVLTDDCEQGHAMQAVAVSPPVDFVTVCGPMLASVENRDGTPTLVLMNVSCMDGFDYELVRREPVTAAEPIWGVLKSWYR